MSAGVKIQKSGASTVIPLITVPQSSIPNALTISTIQSYAAKFAAFQIPTRLVGASAGNQALSKPTERTKPVKLNPGQKRPGSPRSTTNQTQV
jgi:hypothetical protein